MVENGLKISLFPYFSVWKQEKSQYPLNTEYVLKQEKGQYALDTFRIQESSV